VTCTCNQCTPRRLLVLPMQRSSSLGQTRRGSWIPRTRGQRCTRTPSRTPHHRRSLQQTRRRCGRTVPWGTTSALPSGCLSELPPATVLVIPLGALLDWPMGMMKEQKKVSLLEVLMGAVLVTLSETELVLRWETLWGQVLETMSAISLGLEKASWLG
jgi:hypothetical protein